MMDVKLKLTLHMTLALVLTLPSEGIIVIVLDSIFEIPLISVLPLLVTFWLIQWLVSPYVIRKKAHEVSPYDAEYGWVANIVSDISRVSGIPPQGFPD